jgi:ferredoxin
MNVSTTSFKGRGFLESTELQSLFEVLAAKGYRIIGPTVRDGAIVYDEVHSVDELPAGWTDEQSPGAYRLKRRGDLSVFGFGVGPQSWKKFLYPPDLSLWRAAREGQHPQFSPQQHPPEKLAFIGVRACELRAIAIQDRVLLFGEHADSAYAAQRASLFVLAVQCAQAGGNCFCASMQAGPKATTGYDLALTEVMADGRHYFVVDIGTEHGADVLRVIPHRAASAEEAGAADRIVANTARQMTRTLETTGIKDMLYRNADHSHWDAIAQRCLACGNCTLVCPTCFCTAVGDVPDLSGQQTERRRRWDSCFNVGFAYMHGGSVRMSITARYRQWLTHKLAAWIDQCGTSGCVGCGRCITWCPVGIDITEEVRAFQAGASQERHDAAT